jgi:hypothetical protein
VNATYASRGFDEDERGQRSKQCNPREQDPYDKAAPSWQPGEAEGKEDADRKINRSPTVDTSNVERGSARLRYKGNLGIPREECDVVGRRE